MSRGIHCDHGSQVINKSLRSSEEIISYCLEKTAHHLMDYYVMMNADWPQFKSPGYLLDILSEGCMVVSLVWGIVLLEEQLKCPRHVLAYSTPQNQFIRTSLETFPHSLNYDQSNWTVLFFFFFLCVNYRYLKSLCVSGMSTLRVLRGYR